jgi:hypothetical protein
MIRKILRALLFCDDCDVGNVLLHIPVGLINVLIPVALYLVLGLPGVIAGSAVALAFGIGFVAYQITEGAKIKDRIFPDIHGWLYGMGISGVAALVAYLCAGPLV